MPSPEPPLRSDHHEPADLVTGLRALVADADLSPGDASLVWGAFDGDDALTRALEGQAVEPPEPAPGDTTTPVWLSSIAVEGFRGIGARTELLLSARPGLTLVVGRNGSGKSSFAEGIEALLTGDNLRWRDRPKVWQEGWRNLHHEGSAAVSAEFQLEGHQELTELARRWGDGFDDSTVDGRHGGGTALDLDALGWTTALTNYKPLLSYNELGSMLEDSPSAIYDSMATVLGIEQVADARERLRRARLEEEKPGKELAKAKAGLLDELDDSPDDRAAEARGIVAGRSPDLTRLEELAFDRQTEASATLDALSQLAPFDADQADERARSLTDAIAERATAADTDVARSDRVANLLRLALEHSALEHSALDGDTPCPVCGTGTLDESWRVRAEAEAQTMESASRRLRAADAALAEARRSAERTLTPLPTALAGLDPAASGDEPGDALTDLAATVAERWARWAEPPADGWTDDELRNRLGETGELDRAVAALRDEAGKALTAREDEWRPLARAITAWVEQARAADLASARAKRIGKVERFARDAEATLRTSRFQPIADASGRLWEQLRQQSNVSLERVALEGQATRRRVDLDVTVDGTATSALGVMSQGELHALALALFLPRVTTVESPFRFLVIDDPVQAMDPARVDGLARVLAEVATGRQVIVLTHDDRLPAACRRLGIAAEIIEISRRSESRVTATPTDGPAEKAIGDAYALARTERLPEPLKRQVVPMHCRRALEAQIRDLTWARLLGERSHAEVEQLIDDCDTTNHLLALLLFGERRPPGDVYDRLDRIKPGAANHLRFLNSAAHDPPADLNPETLTRTVRNLMTELRGAAW